MPPIGAEAIEDLPGSSRVGPEHQDAAVLALGTDSGLPTSRLRSAARTPRSCRCRSGRCRSGRARNEQRDRLGLDRGGSDVLLFGKGTEDRLCEAEFVKGVQKSLFHVCGRAVSHDRERLRNAGSKRHPAWPGLSVLRKQSDERGEKRLHRSALDFVHAAPTANDLQGRSRLRCSFQMADRCVFCKAAGSDFVRTGSRLRKEAQKLRNQSKNRQKWFINYKVKDRWQGCESLARSATVVVSRRC